MDTAEAEQMLLVIADFFEDHGDERATRLREMVEHGDCAAGAFLTGSRAYGTPREDSDVDLVVLVNPDDLGVLVHASDAETHSSAEGEVFGASVRYGDLNLIAFTSIREYLGWKVATERLKNWPGGEAEHPTRDEAIAEIKTEVKRRQGYETHGIPQAEIAGLTL